MRKDKNAPAQEGTPVRVLVQSAGLKPLQAKVFRLLPGVPAGQTISVYMNDWFLVGDGICPGEYITFRQLKTGEQPPTGSLVCGIVRTPDRSYLEVGHYHRRRGGGVRLATSNPARYKDFVFKPGEIEILCVAVRHEWETPNGQSVEVYLSEVTHDR